MLPMSQKSHYPSFFRGSSWKVKHRQISPITRSHFLFRSINLIAYFPLIFKKMIRTNLKYVNENIKKLKLRLSRNSTFSKNIAFQFLSLIIKNKTDF